MVNRDLEASREEYNKRSLDMDQLLPDPIAQFKQWYTDANENGVVEPNAMSLATVDGFGRPSNRVVLLKSIEEDGFVFYTNYSSKKAKDLNYNRHVAAVFLWLGMERQVRIEGVVEKNSREQSKAYFQSRPRESQIGAWSSVQSKVIENREVLEENKEQIEDRFKDESKLPLPDFWGGYKIIPSKLEFWQGRTSRLHDRFQYKKLKEGWKILRLSP